MILACIMIWRGSNVELVRVPKVLLVPLGVASDCASQIWEIRWDHHRFGLNWRNRSLHVFTQAAWYHPLCDVSWHAVWAL